MGTLLRQGTANFKFGYVLYIMDIVKEENLKPNDIFMKHLESFNKKCEAIVKKVFILYSLYKFNVQRPFLFII